MASKYANLPDIDSAKDVYETEDIDPTQPREKGPDEEELVPPPKDTILNTEEIDGSRLPDREEVGKFFRKAERRRPRRTVYSYPPSPGGSRSPSPDGAEATERVPPLRARLRALQHELSALETELSDPSNPRLLEDTDGSTVDTAEMLKGIREVRGRFTAISGVNGVPRKGLVERTVVAAGKRGSVQAGAGGGVPTTPDRTTFAKGGEDPKGLRDMDQRVAELEKLIGSNNATIDESSPLPPPLLPQINRLSNQITLLTQPRHVEQISRRLKVLLVELEKNQNLSKGTGKSSGVARTSDADETSSSAPSSAPTLPPDLAPILQRLSPLLPTIPHLLQRLRTLSSLHTSASSFASTLTSLEDDQKKVRAGLVELDNAVKGVEKGLEDNIGRTEGNLKGLEARIDALMASLAELGPAGSL